MVRSTAAIVTMVEPIANAGVADTLEARLADARKRHADGEYRTIPLLIVKLGIRSQWATKHPSRSVSPRPVRNQGGVDDKVDGGARVSGNNGTKQRGVIKVDGGVDKSQVRVQQTTAAAGSSRADIDGRRRSPLRSGGGLSATTHVTAGGIAPTNGYFKFSPDWITVAPLQGRRDLITWRGSIEPQLEVAGLKGFADGTVPILSVDDVGLCGEFHAAHLLTFMVILKCCSPVVQVALRSCQERLDAGHQAWHFNLSTHQVRDDLYIALLEEKMTHIRMGEQESAMDYCICAQRILAEMRMAGAKYSMASYISHIVKGLPRGYNLMKRMMMVPETRESLDEDSITSYILQNEAMQEAEQPTELLPRANYATPMKLNQQQGQRRKPSEGGRSTEDVDEKRSKWDKGRGGGGRRRECWICHDPNHLSYECPDSDDSDEDDTKGGRGRSTSRRPCRDAKPCKEKQTSKKTSSTKDVDNSSGVEGEVWAGVGADAGTLANGHLDGDGSLLAEVNEPADEDVVEVLPPSPVLAPPFPVADRPASTPVSATGNEGSLEASHVVLASGIAGGRQGAKLVDQDGKPSTTGEQQTGEPVEQEAATGVQSTGEPPKSAGSEQLVEGSKQLVDNLTVDKEGELSAGDESTDSDVVEVPITKPELRRTSRA
ncbi:unnamed protein product [Closterium sp. NIES-54]